jgi:hypothetical protein
MGLESERLAPPDASYVRQRFIPAYKVEWVQQADAIMREYGLVTGSVLCRTRRAAQWRAEKLIRYMVELRMYDRGQLVEHTSRRSGGWVWSVEYRGRIPDAS